MMVRASVLVFSSVCVVGCPKPDTADAVPGPAAPTAEQPPPAEPPPQPDGAAEGVAEGIAVGQRAPEFEVQDEAGNTVRLSQHRGERAVLLAFYPKDFTGG
jgi:hypothetical protein